MIGVFVQLNADSPGPMSRSHPVGYVIQENGCWDWVGATNGRGYGSFWANGRRERAHRAIYERHRGPIPEGLTLDHLCRNTRCVNPDHLEAVQHRVNVLRGEGIAAINAVKTHCPNGHPLTQGNLVTSKLAHRRRNCRQCQNDCNRAYRARRKGLV